MKTELNLTHQDLDQIVGMHMKHLPEGLLTALGEQFLKEFYSALNADSHAFIIVERSSSGIVGFVTGGTSLSGVKRYFKQNFFHTLLLMKYLLFKPKLLLRLALSIKRSLFKRKNMENQNTDAELYSLVVDTSSQRKGVASKLYDGLSNTFRCAEIYHFEIVVGSELKIAQIFYKSKGAVKVRIIQQGLGKRSFVYAQTIEKEKDS